jgi:glycosyltransferase involved in cell wall biosynthesis
MNPTPIAVVIAALNEEKGIGPTLDELRRVLGDCYFLVIDGNSIDRTVQISKDYGADVIFQQGIGKGSAIAQAIDYIEYDPKYVIFTDADFTYPSKYVIDMLSVLETNPNIGMVLGNRFNHLLTSSAMKNPFYIGNRFLALAQRFLNNVNLSDPLTGLRVIRWNILKDWKPKSKGFDIEAEMNHLVENHGYEIFETAIPYRDRVGEKKLKLRHGLLILKRIVSESL